MVIGGARVIIETYNCYNSCNTCSDLFYNNCTSCSNDLFLTNVSTCESFCFPPYYGDRTNNKCMLCDDICSSCVKQGIDQCLTCSNNLFLQQDFGPAACLPTCLLNTYKYNTNFTCLSCDITCSTCIQQGNDQCLTCADNLYLQKIFIYRKSLVLLLAFQLAHRILINLTQITHVCLVILVVQYVINKESINV